MKAYENSIIYGGMSLVCALFHIFPLIAYYPKSDKVFYTLLGITTLWTIAFFVCLIIFIVLRIKGKRL